MAFDYSLCHWKWFPFPCTEFMVLKTEKLWRKDNDTRLYLNSPRAYLDLFFFFFLSMVLYMGDPGRGGTHMTDVSGNPQREAVIQGHLFS